MGHLVLPSTFHVATTLGACPDVDQAAAPSVRNSRLLAFAFCGVCALAGCDNPTVPAILPTPTVSTTVNGGWDAPEHLGVPINSAAVELQVGIAPNGRTLFITSGRAGTLGQQDIFVSSKLPDGTWSEPQHLGPNVNSSTNDVSPSLSIDGHYLYFASSRPGGFGGVDCWRSYRDDPADDLGWQPAENLGPNVNTSADEADCLPFRAGDATILWFTSLNRPGGLGDWDIYTSEMQPDGTFAPATSRLDLNTQFRETRMTLSGNGHRIYFTSNRPGGLGGIDIWTADRATPNADFCTPVNMGAPINTSDNDRSPSITTDGAELYFTSTRPGGLGNDDVYVLRHQGGFGPPTHCDQ